MYDIGFNCSEQGGKFIPNKGKRPRVKLPILCFYNKP